MLDRSNIVSSQIECPTSTKIHLLDSISWENIIETISMPNRWRLGTACVCRPSTGWTSATTPSRPIEKLEFRAQISISPTIRPKRIWINSTKQTWILMPAKTRRHRRTPPISGAESRNGQRLRRRRPSISWVPRRRFVWQWILLWTWHVRMVLRVRKCLIYCALLCCPCFYCWETDSVNALWMIDRFSVRK